MSAHTPSSSRMNMHFVPNSFLFRRQICYIISFSSSCFSCSALIIRDSRCQNTTRFLYRLGRLSAECLSLRQYSLQFGCLFSLKYDFAMCGFIWYNFPMCNVGLKKLNTASKLRTNRIVGIWVCRDFFFILRYQRQNTIFTVFLHGHPYTSM